MADDRGLLTQRSPTGHLLQADPRHPGTGLSSAGASEIKRITAGVKAGPLVLPARIGPATGLHPPDVFKVEEYCVLSISGHPPLLIGRYKRTSGQPAPQVPLF